VDECALDLVFGAKPLVGFRSGLDILHLDLHERAAAPANVNVIALDHAPDALIPLEQVADPDLDRFHLCHKDLMLLGKRRALYSNCGTISACPTHSIRSNSSPDCRTCRASIACSPPTAQRSTSARRRTSGSALARTSAARHRARASR